MDENQDTERQAEPRRLFRGRRRILAAPSPIDAESAPKALDRALVVQSLNAADIRYLHSYFLGDQPVLHRKKPVRPDINNPVVENRAYQICKDRTDAIAGEPITYSAHGIGDGGSDEELSTRVQRLNDCCIAADKHSADLELVQWMNEVGVGYRLILPSKDIAGPERPDRPFAVCTLDPRSTFVVYSNDVFHAPLFAVTEVIDPQTDERTYTMYTESRRFVIRGGRTVSEEPNPLGMVPIIEYQANPERMGIFEAVLSLFDAINEVESNRVDGIAQFVQSLMVLTNVDIDEDEFSKMLKLGAVKISSSNELPAGVQLLTAELNQDQTQTLVDSFYKTALSICGMPFNVGGSASTSDTGAAVTMRDGWSNSENRCKETEILFKRSERLFLDAALHILDVSEHLGLTSSNVEIKFTRRNYEAIQSKTQVLTTLLGSGKVAPRLAFQYCGMFSDPEDAYDQSKRYVDEQRALAQQAAANAPAPQGGAAEDGSRKGASGAQDDGSGAARDGSGEG